MIHMAGSKVRPKESSASILLDLAVEWEPQSLKQESRVPV